MSGLRTGLRPAPLSHPRLIRRTDPRAAARIPTELELDGETDDDQATGIWNMGAVTEVDPSLDRRPPPTPRDRRIHRDPIATAVREARRPRGTPPAQLSAVLPVEAYGSSRFDRDEIEPARIDIRARVVPRERAVARGSIAPGEVRVERAAPRRVEPAAIPPIAVSRAERAQSVALGSLLESLDRQPDWAPSIEAPTRAATAIEPPRQVARKRRLAVPVGVAAVALATAAVVAIVQVSFPHAETPRHIAALDAASPPANEPRMQRVALSALESTRAYHPRSGAYRDLWRESVWYHPLTGEALMPMTSMRKFGARREGRRPTECGRGHCGVDLGKFGLTVRAVQAGTIERLARKAFDRAGKYVRIAHDDGYVSYYIHMHDIRADLQVGMRVEGGEELGTVGRTGIKRSAPHLHFALAYRSLGKLIFVDPEPMLRFAIPSSREDLEEAARLARSTSADEASGAPVGAGAP